MKRIKQFERTDRDITNALLLLLEKNRFEKITVAQIIEEAGINRSTFYQHFSDKYEIVERTWTSLSLWHSLSAPWKIRISMIMLSHCRPIFKKTAPF